MISQSFLSGFAPMDIRRLNLLTALQLKLISWGEYVKGLESLVECQDEIEEDLEKGYAVTSSCENPSPKSS